MAEVPGLFATRPILGVNVAVSSCDTVVERCLTWAQARESRTLCFSTVHMIMEAVDDPAFLHRLNSIDIVNPDGVPLVWALGALGARGAQRVYGPDITVLMLEAAEKARIPVGFFGGSQRVLNALVATVRAKHPRLNIAYQESPPFRAMTEEEDQAVIDRMTASGTRLLFVGLGCPKQENWLVEHAGKVPAVMLAVGAAFDFLAGAKPQAPRWMMRCGLEWLFRLLTEPRRLARRYLKNNPRFVVKFLRQLLAGQG
ncbi:MAG: WecB/TagA/CpsF family glycosyltransferase [Terracidiphilus sp.]|nr:WecB/TagA/CpsF family glycosyltransferase [Terracidiphilus sp.]